MMVQVQHVDIYIMTYSLTKLRKEIFTVVDNLIKTGKSVYIQRNGHRIKLVLDEPHSKLDNLVPHPDVMVDEAESYIHEDWSKYWQENKNL